jgi:recombination protein RecT
MNTTYTTSATPEAIHSQAIEKVEKKTALDRIRAYAEMEEVKKRFINLLGDRDGRAYVESVVIAVANDEKLQECTPKSIMISAMRAASLKLSVDKSMKQAHLVPFGKEATLIIDYHGLVQLSVNTNYYEIPPNVFEVWEGETVKLDRFSGRVEIEGEMKNNVAIGWCGYFKAKNGTERWLYMTNEQCDAHGQKYNPGGFNSKKSGWSTDREKMRRKTVLRQLVSLWGNFSPQVQNVILRDEPIDAEAFDLPDAPEVKSAPEIKTNAAANVSILTGNGNPDPIKDATWDEFLKWSERAAKVSIVVPDIKRTEHTEADLRLYIGTELSHYVTDAEAQATAGEASQDTLL